MNFLFRFFFVGLIMLGCVTPSFASSSIGRSPNYRPIYLQETLYIVKNKCKAVSMIPYSGDVYYECPNGEAFWSDVLVPTELSFLFKNRKHEDDLNNSSYSSLTVVN
jgi:hypothetical protein